MAGIVDQIIGVESGGNPYARNARSSAAGLGQFTDATWLDMLRRHRPDLVQGKSPEQLLALKMDPTLSREMTGAYAGDNSAFLRSKGIEPTPGNQYLAHFAGPGGAAAIYADPGKTVEALLGPKAVAANPFLAGKTGRDVIAWADAKMNPSQRMMAGILRKRVGTAPPDALPQPAAVPPAAAGIDRLKAALGGRAYDTAALARADQFLAGGAETAKGAKNWMDVLNSALQTGLGTYEKYYGEGKKKKEFDENLRQGLGSASDTAAIARLLMASPDPQERELGIGLLAKAEAAAKTAQESFGKTPVWGVDANGNPALVQVSDRGRSVQTTLPQGVKVGKDPIKMDAGTHFVLLDPVTRQPIGQIPKDVAGEEQQKAVGKGTGERIIAQPATNTSLRSSLAGLDRLAESAQKLKALPGLPSAVGNIQGRWFVPTFRQSTADAEAEMEKLKSQVAVSVLQAMRDASKTGGALGSIAVEELKMLQNNLASLDPTQGDEKFMQSLDEIVRYTEGAKERLRRGYKDTYGEEFTDEGASQPEPPPAATGGYKVLKVH